MGLRTSPLFTLLKPILSFNLTVFVFKTQCSNTRYILLYNWMNWPLVTEQWTSSVFVSVSFFRYKYSHTLSHSPFLFTLQCHLSIFLSVHVGFYLVKRVSCNRTLLNLVFNSFNKSISFSWGSITIYIWLLCLCWWCVDFLLVLNSLLAVFRFYHFIVWWLTIPTMLVYLYICSHRIYTFLTPEVSSFLLSAGTLPRHLHPAAVMSSPFPCCLHLRRAWQHHLHCQLLLFWPWNASFHAPLIWSTYTPLSCLSDGAAEGSPVSSHFLRFKDSSSELYSWRSHCVAVSVSPDHIHLGSLSPGSQHEGSFQPQTHWVVSMSITLAPLCAHWWSCLMLPWRLTHTESPDYFIPYVWLWHSERPIFKLNSFLYLIWLGHLTKVCILLTSLFSKISSSSQNISFISCMSSLFHSAMIFWALLFKRLIGLFIVCMYIYLHDFMCTGAQRG